MTQWRLRAARPPGVRVRWLLLVLGVLAGVVAMHGLGSVAAKGAGRAAAASHHGGPAATAPGSVGAHVAGERGGVPDARTQTGVHQPGAHEAGPPRALTRIDAECGHTGGAGGGGHLSHADPTCAAGGIASAPALPDPAPAPAAAAGPPAATGRTASAERGDRAPPSLSQLQLLRI
ncbi:DUF6153 family protein [Streptomyces sp. URMC 123]|uniref:DUF6153 family protein n=1 Tax=Streptomyces sp. URMC 123 TaxID=3423403 RepID=UPI003F1C95E5